MLTQAARRFSTSRSAMRCAAARSGTLVNTTSVRMGEALVDGRIAEAQAEHALHARVVEAARLAHERIALRRNAALDLYARETRRPRQAVARGDELHPVGHAQLAVVGDVIDAGRRVILQRAH